MPKIKMIDCPNCDHNFNYYESEFRPFCCERCKMIDLGHWLSESYVVKTNEPLCEEDIEKIEKDLDEKIN